jgi:Lar family restriction alleviation protein
MKLKECPFCGGEAITLKNTFRQYGVGCNDNDCEVEPGIAPIFDYESEAIEAWNRRDDPLTEAVRWYFECSDFINSGAVKGTGVDEICQSLMWALKDLRRLVGEK